MKAKAILAAILIVSVLCSLSLAAWTEPVPVTEVNTEYEEMPPFLSFDGLSLYFSRVRTDTFYHARIFEARRENAYGPFTSVNEVLSSSYQHFFAPWVSPDNLRMYYFAQTINPILWQIKVSERASVNEPWPQGTDISELNALGRVHAPTLTADELIIFFDSPDIPGEGGYDIWMATRPNIGSPFDEVTNLTEINTTANDGGPYVTPDGLTLLFHSNRNGSYQIFRATRQSLSEPFGNVEHLPAFDTPGGLSCHPSLSSDSSALYFIRQFGDDRATRDIYVSYDPYMVAVRRIENAIAEKLETLEKINAAIEMESIAYEALAELLDSGDYGDLNEKAITKAMKEIESSIQQEELSIKALDRSIEKLEDALAFLGWQPPEPVITPPPTSP